MLKNTINAADRGAIFADLTWDDRADARTLEDVDPPMGALAAWYLKMLEAAPAAIYATDACGVVTFYNRAAAELAGREPRIGVDEWCVTWRLYHPDGTPLPHDQCPMAIALKERRALRGLEAVAERPDGTRIPFQPYPTPLFDAEGNLVGALNMLVDITERKRSEARIQHLAFHDSLTGLPNRASFEARLSQAVTGATTSGKRFSVLWLDLDRFKEVNDTFGHAVGDGLLRAVADRLRVAAAGAFLARMGGDEFTIILQDDLQPAASEELADRLLKAFARDIEVDGHLLRVGLSIGVAICPDDGLAGARLVARADAAMYRAKAEGHGGVRFFDRRTDERQRERRALQNDLQAALEEDRFVLHYQPQARVSGEIVAFEALVRWDHPSRGLIPPSTFIPIAEECGAIMPLSAWVLRAACREAAGWPSSLRVSVNLSPAQFRHGDLPALVERILHETRLAPERLELELTEGVLIHDFGRAASTLRRLKALGIQIAMDDFGTGYSSLSYLQGLPFSKLKIDRSFVARIGQDEPSAEIVRSIIGLGHVLRLAVVAEGVETLEQREFLTRHGCDELQGFLIGRPAPISTFASLITGDERRDEEIDRNRLASR